MSLFNSFRSKPEPDAAPVGDAGSVQFTVPDMSCGHCEAAIRGALGDALPGRAVTVDLAAKRVAVAAAAAETETAADAIRSAGYEPQPAGA
ncbi:heavy-metal-associated domain-containing protein [Jiella sonneratiae]|uniref:Heavy-metal-associated domain-containing protein n=1 Tax=Jiella sonneratiae TaxID=2816856 RepID=A0ABS3J970_9HYPH|nr:heavy-metal-associated domain-containing protein [Jiella sonneratiae]MBO0906225.1 heavy-metal-associated domain-containing protein [Jiella sonneratiae]